MKRIDELFVVHRARSDILPRYQPGDIPYIGNGFSNNAVAGFVTPRQGDSVFHFRGLAVSAFCEATVQVPPFLPCGRAGNGVLALQPIRQMTSTELAFLAAYINMAVRWRFNWYRQTTATRVSPILVPDEVPHAISFSVQAELPKVSRVRQKEWALNLEAIALGDLFDLVPGDYHSLASMPVGNVPVVSCGDRENGISAYRAVQAPLYRGKLTIAFNGMNTLTAKYHPYHFAAKDDVAVCTPRHPLRLTTLLFIPVMLNRERWRYSYYRKCFVEKLKRFKVKLPVKNGTVDEDTIQAIMESSHGWASLNPQLS